MSCQRLSMTTPRYSPTEEPPVADQNRGADLKIVLLSFGESATCCWSGHLEAALAQLVLGLGGELSFLLFDDATVEEVDDAIRVLRVARVVRDHADGRAGAVQF